AAALCWRRERWPARGQTLRCPDVPAGSDRRRAAQRLPDIADRPSDSQRGAAPRSRFLGHLEEQQKRQLGDVLVIRDAIVAQDMDEVPEPGNDVLGGGHAASPCVLSITTLYH